VNGRYSSEQGRRHATSTRLRAGDDDARFGQQLFDLRVQGRGFGGLGLFHCLIPAQDEFDDVPKHGRQDEERSAGQRTRCRPIDALQQDENFAFRDRN
jgi:hypothetical protein